MVLIPLISFSEEIELSCMINKELENNKPARKKLFMDKKISLYLNKEENWLYETKKKEWKRLNLEKSDLISQTFKENIRNIIFVKKIFYTEEKKLIQSIDEIVLVKQTMEMIYLKEYYNSNNKYFSSEIRGVCK
tara:strand:- start:284 stop:685 length:402 start_codon:yes stop_codon:yes gene_type:complete